ncbi:hypothetical protein UVI_02022670 [Ustilaginoidea virens]|uniref:BET3 family protein n=1 Tax=Ustilaginoidea virens TaxID=1159556 RepID=A0A1B5L7M2_USTVR|nr:hypothetical protein UVI_02022670 [Ustilaginoidea virens]
MSLDPVMPPYNASDHHASFLSSSCLDFLLIELVPLAHRVASSRGASRSLPGPPPAEAAAKPPNLVVPAKGGQKGPRFSRDRPRFNDTLEVIKFLCKDLWSLVFGKNIDNLKTNHRGVYVLTDNAFRPFSRMSTDAGGQAVVRAQPFLWFPCGIVRGALAALGTSATVEAEINDLPGAVFQIKALGPKP